MQDFFFDFVGCCRCCQDIIIRGGNSRHFTDISLDEFLGDRDKQDITSFRLVVATEAAIDICLHVAAKILREAPEEYAGRFLLLGDHDIIDRDLASRLVKMARFRNLLVHRYWEIDYSRMYKIITGPDLDDLERFMRRIEQLCREDGNERPP